MHPTFRTAGGFSLVELLIALGVGGAVIAAGYTLLNRVGASDQMLVRQSELLDLKTKIRQAVDCKATLDPYRMAGGKVPAGTPVALRGKRGLKSGVELFTPVKSGPFAGSSRAFGSWHVQAVWSGTGITVLAARLAGTGKGAARHPLIKDRLDDFAADFNPLFGGNSAYQLCRAEVPAGFELAFLAPTVRAAEAATGLKGQILNCHELLNSGLVPNRSCQKYCKAVDYDGGWLSECQAFHVVSDASGFVTGFDPINPPDLHHLGCSCVR